MKIDEYYEEEFSFTQEHVNKFAEISGDNNPVHVDSEYSKKTIFCVPIMHGMLGASVFSKILGTIFPGDGTIYRKQYLSFNSPMYVNTQYIAKLTILEIDSVKGSARIETII